MSPVACIIGGNFQLNALSHIPDNFQSETEMVFDRQPNPSRIALLQIYLNKTPLSCLAQTTSNTEIFLI